MERLEAPKMWEMWALALRGYSDIWFAGRPYEPDTGNAIVNYYRGKWTYYQDPSPYGMRHLHLFSHAAGWGFENNRIYRFDGQGWNLWLELAAFQSITPCAFKSQTNVWAVGSYADKSRTGNVVLHYDGAAWREVFCPGENKYVFDVSMYNNNNGWAVGAVKVGTEYYGRTWQCLNGVWLERVCPVKEAIYDVEAVSKTEAWASNSHKILHYQTESIITPTSFGRIKTLFAEGRGSDSNATAAHASRVPHAPPPTAFPRAERHAGADSEEQPAAAAD
jgi:hypothetical protein